MFVARVRPVYLDQGPSTWSSLGRDSWLPGALLVGSAVAVFLWLLGGPAREQEDARAGRRRAQSRVYRERKKLREAEAELAATG
jgi:hypothetical protein